MPRLSVTQIACLILSAVLLEGSRTATPRKPAVESSQAITTAVLRLEDMLDDAESHHDVNATSRLIADDYRGITLTGGIIGKEDVLKEVASGAEASSKASERSVRLLENAAIYTALVIDQGVDEKTGEPYSITTRVTDVWQRQGREWRLVNDHASLVTQRPR